MSFFWRFFQSILHFSTSSPVNTSRSLFSLLNNISDERMILKILFHVSPDLKQIARHKAGLRDNIQHNDNIYALREFERPSMVFEVVTSIGPITAKLCHSDA